MNIGLELSTSEGCAWRAIYLSVLRRNDLYHVPERRQFAHLGIDPSSSRANIFGAVGSCHFRFFLPFAIWRQNQWYICTLWQRFLHSLDGRF